MRQFLSKAFMVARKKERLRKGELSLRVFEALPHPRWLNSYLVGTGLLFSVTSRCMGVREKVERGPAPSFYKQLDTASATSRVVLLPPMS